MNDRAPNVATRLESIVEEFAELEPRERLELLVDFAEKLQALPERFQARRAAGENRVQECQTEVYLWVEVVDDAIQIHVDVAPEAPTVQGFVALLVDVLWGTHPNEIEAVQPVLLQQLGLAEALGMVRMRGLTGVINRIRREVELA